MILPIICCILPLISGISAITEKQYAAMPPLFHLDNYDHCMLHGDDARYCMATLQLTPRDPDNEIWSTIQELSSKPSNYRHDVLRHGVCIPETCPGVTNLNFSDDFSRCYGAQFRKLGFEMEVVELRCETAKSPYVVDSIDYGFLIFAVLYMGLIVVASLYEGVARYKTQEEYSKITGTSWGKVASAFSIPKNWLRLKTVNLDNADVRDLRCIQGIRFYNMICVIMSHTVMLDFSVPVSNPRYTETMTQKVLNMFLANGGYAVQTFFMISAWLLTYHFFTTFERTQRVTPRYLLLALINRYIRLTPTLAVMIAFHSTWLVHISRGPIWDMLVGEEYRRCRENWWTNLLYINSYVNRERMCMAQTWYVAIDTQFFILALLLLWCTWKRPKMLALAVTTLILLHISVLFVVIYWNNWESTIRPLPEDLYALKVIELPQWHMILASTYSNLVGLPTGIALGYIFYKYRQRKDLFNRKLYVWMWWILVWGLGLGIIVFPGMIMYAPEYQHDRVFAAVYGSVSRTAFVFAIGLGIFGMTQGIGWMVKWTCEWPPTYVLGRLTYSAYLVNTVFVRIRGGIRRTPHYLADYSMFEELLSDIALSYIGGLFLTLLVELPVSELQKRLIPKQNVARTAENGDCNKKRT